MQRVLMVFWLLQIIVKAQRCAHVVGACAVQQHSYLRHQSQIHQFEIHGAAVKLTVGHSS